MFSKGKTSAVVFCGDFNSSPKSGAVELITSGRIPADHSHWTSGTYWSFTGHSNAGYNNQKGIPEFATIKHGFSNKST